MYDSTRLSILSLNGGAEAPLIHGGADASGGGLAGLVEHLLDHISRLLEPGHSFFQFMPGIAGLAFNVHPLIVHFPIAFLLGFFALELAGLPRGRQNLRTAASWMLYLGAAGAVLAAAAGLIAETRVPHGEEVHAIMEWHGRLGLTVATLAVILATWMIVVRGRFMSAMAHSLYIVLGAIMTVCMLIGADLGGLMVYQYGVGVKQLQQVDDHHHHMAPETADAPSRTP